MPYFNKELNELVYNAAESDPFDCPVCGAQLSFGDCDILDKSAAAGNVPSAMLSAVHSTILFSAATVSR